MKTKLKRISAYILDNLLIGLICILLSFIPFINPKLNETKDLYNQTYDITTKQASFLLNIDNYLKDDVLDKDEYDRLKIDYKEYNVIKDLKENTEYKDKEIQKIKDKINEESLDKTNDLAYQIKKNDLIRNILEIILSLLYFGVLQYFMKGKTLFKMSLKLKVIDNNKKDVSLVKMLLRSLLANEIIFQIVNVIGLIFLEKNNYIYFYSMLRNIQYLFECLMITSIILREDNAGLHDLILNTKVNLENEKSIN